MGHIDMDKGPRADALEEENRQAWMRELRRLVGRDLLAGVLKPGGVRILPGSFGKRWNSSSKPKN